MQDTTIRRYVAAITLAWLPLCASAADKKQPGPAASDVVASVDVPNNTVTVIDRSSKKPVTYAVTTNTEIYVFHAAVGLDKLLPKMKVAVTTSADPKVAARIDGLDQPPPPAKKKAGPNKAAPKKP